MPYISAAMAFSPPPVLANVWLKSSMDILKPTPGKTSNSSQYPIPPVGPGYWLLQGLLQSLGLVGTIPIPADEQCQTQRMITISEGNPG